MRIIHSEKNRLRTPRSELSGGTFVPPFDSAARVDAVLARIAETGLGPVEPPEDHGLEPLRLLHCPVYLDFLANA